MSRLAPADGPGTLNRMAKKINKGGRPKGRKPARTVFARVDPALVEWFHKHVQSLQPRTSLSGVIEMLMHRYREEIRGVRESESE
jgi:hypothetical protein